MKLQFVGPKPIVSQHGITFDKNQPDCFIYIYTVVQFIKLVEDFDTEANGGVLNILNYHREIIDNDRLNEYVRSICSENIENILRQSDEALQSYIESNKNKIEHNQKLEPDEKRAWLGNIEITREYCRQFFLNETVYSRLLEKLAHKICERKIKKIVYRFKGNFANVFFALEKMLAEHKPPVIADMYIEAKEGKLLGILNIN